MCFYVWGCHFFKSFLRGLFQYGDLHFGHCFGFGVLFCHVLPHREHVSVGNGGVSLVSIICIFTPSTSILFFMFFCSLLLML